MNIYSESGSKVKYLDENGYDSDVIRARSLGLVKGEVYTVTYTDVSDMSTAVILKEFPNYRFNSVMFEDFTEEDSNLTALKERAAKQIATLRERIEKLQAVNNEPDIGKCYILNKDGTIAYYKVLNFYDVSTVYADEYAISNRSVTSSPDCIVSKRFLREECKLIQVEDFDSASNIVEGILTRTYNDILEEQ